MPNRWRGETEVELLGRTYRVRPTIDAVLRVEGRTERGILGIARDLARGEVGLTTTAAILHAGAVGLEASYQDVLKEVAERGLWTYVDQVTAFCEAASFGMGPQETPSEQTISP